jgi:signal transduction histidine kinase
VPLPLRPLIDAAWSAQQTRAPEARLVVTMAEDLRWRCDPEQLTAALGELLANALAATPPPQIPQVRLTVTCGQEGCLFSLDDDGCGVVAADQPRLFRLFANRHEDDGGGVGLALVREVAEGHGGRVILTDGPGRGTRVIFSLPR